MTVHASDAAREIRRRLPGSGVVKVHKLLYFAQGTHIARHGEPLFAEQIRAWANGPVVAVLWRAENYQDQSSPPATDLSDIQASTIDEVVWRYGHLTGTQLIRLTHTEGPWVDVTEDPFALDESPEISLDTMAGYFKGLLASADEEAARASRHLVDTSPHYRLQVPAMSASLQSAIDATS